MPADLHRSIQSSLGTTYTLDRELSGGGMSRVFVADDAALGRKVVVKVLALDVGGELSVERFTREIHFAASLQHPNIVPVLSAGVVDDRPYYTMPFVDGESARDRLEREGTFSVRAALTLMRDVAKALEYAHERGVIHRDIKPDNVLLSGRAAAVADFGIAKAVSVSVTERIRTTLTRAGMAIGTPEYMAPEQGACDPAMDHRADLYSLGCTVYELLVGTPPFRGRTAFDTIAKHMTEPVPPIFARRADCPPEFALLLARCLEKDPAARPADAAELLEALDEVRPSGRTPMWTGAIPAVPVEATPSPVRRPLLLALIGLAGIVGVVAAGLLLR